MTLVYYSAKADSVFVIESDNGSSLSMYCVLAVNNVDYGWIFLGEL